MPITNAVDGACRCRCHRPKTLAANIHCAHCHRDGKKSVPGGNPLLNVLRDARWALVTDYTAAGGDDEAKTNVLLRNRRRLIDRIDRAITKSESR